MQDAALLEYEKKQREQRRTLQKPGTLWSRLFGPRKSRVYVMTEEMEEPAKDKVPQTPMSPKLALLSPRYVAKQLADFQEHRKQTQVQKAEEKRNMQR
jgi:hypothetical protein